MAQAPPKTRNLGRLTEIAQVAVRHGFGYFFERHKLTDLIPGRRNGTELLEGSASERGKHLRELLDELGPTFVKFGQLLSMRPDVLPPDIITELRGLQDDVRPFPYEEVERVVLEDLGLPIERLFLEFDREPLAAASIGQVHRAVLPNGHVVAVKVQRPGAPEQIEQATRRWRGEAVRVGEKAGSGLEGLFQQLGLVTHAELEELELRVAQLEHRLRLVEGEPNLAPRPPD